MSLPSDFQTMEEYFQEATNFLSQNSWIYETSNTKFVQNQVLDKIPTEWRAFFSDLSNDDFNQFPNGLNNITLPKSLEEFQNNLTKLKPKSEILPFPADEIHFRSASPKKLHEIARLAFFINEICSTDIDILIDFGSGLGYLAEVLTTRYNFKILGLECEESCVVSSRKRQTTYYAQSKGQVFFKQHMITNESGSFIQSEIKELYPQLNVHRTAIIGLHSCGDLSITSIRLFFETDFFKKLIIMPCCYHKLKLSDSQDGSFENIPLSKTFERALENCGGKRNSILNRPFLRLACQETVSRWMKMSGEDHKLHGKVMFARGLVECLLNDEEIAKKIPKTKLSNGDLTFEEIEANYEIRSVENDKKTPFNASHAKKFNDVMLKYPDGGKMSEILTCLQTALQSLCENIVLLDRICYIKERSQEMAVKITTKIEKIVDDRLSPRCFMFIVEKDV